MVLARAAPCPIQALLDGSNLPAEKRPEHGMLGEFELPGSEEKGEKVSGTQPEQSIPPGRAGAQTDKQDKTPQGSAGGGAPSNNDKTANTSAGNGQSQRPAQNDPNAKAQGTQVAELKTDGNSGSSADGPAANEKPGQVALGDSAMQIKPITSSPAIVGSQQPAGSTQQSEKAMPSGKASSGGRGQGGVERGRTMPSGL